jgi:hypothetical protein
MLLPSVLLHSKSAILKRLRRRPLRTYLQKKRRGKDNKLLLKVSDTVSLVLNFKLREKMEAQR